MGKTDILETNLYIKKFMGVIKSQNPNINKPAYINGRLSDAFVYIISGSCSYEFDDGTEFTVKKGDILYLAHNSVYKMHIHTTDYKFIFCDFEFDSNPKRKSDVYSPKNITAAENLFLKLINCYLKPEKSSFSECMALLYEIYSLIKSISDKEYITPSSRNKIKYAKSYIDTNFKNPELTISQLAENSGMSEVYFRKLFKAEFGTSPYQYIISMRLNHSKTLMKYPFLSLEECAIQSGFSSLQYFCRVFKKNVGTTPANYRKKD